MKIDLPDEAATIDLGRRLAEALPRDSVGWTILLQGELGAGKSTLTRALLRALGHTGAVPSPTYTLVEPYRLDNRHIYHVDLYRVANEEELRYLGWNELEDGLRLVEWPERAPGLADSADLAVRLDYAGDGRVAEFDALSARGRALLGRMGARSAATD